MRDLRLEAEAEDAIPEAEEAEADGEDAASEATSWSRPNLSTIFTCNDLQCISA